MMSVTTFIIAQASIILLFVIGFIIRNIIVKNKKLTLIVATQNKYLEDLYIAVKASEEKIKEIDAKQIFQSDDEIGWFFKGIKEIQKELSTYMEFIALKS